MTNLPRWMAGPMLSGVEPSPNAWYIGDSAGDCRAASAAGVSFAWVTWGYESQPPVGAGAHIKRFRQVLEL